MSTVATKERPILFSGEMVRAILEGRKTQTRRVVLPQPMAGPLPGGKYEASDAWVGADCVWRFMRGAVSRGEDDIGRCPYGQPGDRLWVREAWAREDEYLIYRADLTDWSHLPGLRWKPSIHMPRAASRLTLEITDVRVERIRDISEEDCRAEGAPGGDSTNELGWRYSFGSLWNSINEARGYGWDANPWVWVVSFRRVQP